MNSLSSSILPKGGGRQRVNKKKSDESEVAGAVKKQRTKTCYAFQSGNCNRGDQCKFEHTIEDLSAPVPPPVVILSSNVTSQTPSAHTAAAACRAFAKGNCSRGSNCRFAHVLSAKPAASTSSPVPMELASPAAASAPAFMTSTRFASLAISPLTIRAITETMGYTTLTEVQDATLPHILQQKDVLAKAKTGTGKTLAFLIPAVELLLRNKSKVRKQAGGSVSVLVLSPTRELAQQISREADTLLQHHEGMTAVTIVGGTNMNSDVRKIKGKDVSFLIATPGRLLDHLKNTPGFSSQCRDHIQMIILDEADQLLEMGFKPDIDRIFTHMPDAANRQTLLFSATVSREIQQIASQTLRQNYSFINTVPEEEEQTHEHVEQTMSVVTMELLIPAILSLLIAEQKRQTAIGSGYKVLVFFATARVAGYMAELFSVLMGTPILEMHSRKSQSYREKTAKQFHSGNNVIMFSSDVSARGMDYPDITYVLQVGLTEKAQYIHRLGRTARGTSSTEGRGMLLLADFEEKCMRKELSELNLQTTPIQSLQPFEATVASTLGTVRSNSDLSRSAEQAYQAWLGFYNGKLRVLGWSKELLVQMANRYAATLGCSEVPALQKKTIGKMGLKGVPGLRVQTEASTNIKGSSNINRNKQQTK